MAAEAGEQSSANRSQGTRGIEGEILKWKITNCGNFPWSYREENTGGQGESIG